MMAPISAVARSTTPLSGLPTAQSQSGPGNAIAATGAGFGDALKDAVHALGDLGAQADASTLQLATGEAVDVHDVMLQVEQASLGFQVALQVRNKLVDAYQEIMRMSL